MKREFIHWALCENCGTFQSDTYIHKWSHHIHNKKNARALQDDLSLYTSNTPFIVETQSQQGT